MSRRSAVQWLLPPTASHRRLLFKIDKQIGDLLAISCNKWEGLGCRTYATSDAKLDHKVALCSCLSTFNDRSQWVSVLSLYLCILIMHNLVAEASALIIESQQCARVRPPDKFRLFQVLSNSELLKSAKRVFSVRMNLKQQKIVFINFFNSLNAATQAESS